MGPRFVMFKEEKIAIVLKLVFHGVFFCAHGIIDPTKEVYSLEIFTTDLVFS